MTANTESSLETGIHSLGWEERTGEKEETREKERGEGIRRDGRQQEANPQKVDSP